MIISVTSLSAVSLARRESIAVPWRVWPRLVLISLLWGRMTRNGALAGMVVGAVTVLVWQHYQWFKLYEIVPGFTFSAIAIIVVSLLEKAPSATITAKHREVEAEIAAHGE